MSSIPFTEEQQLSHQLSISSDKLRLEREDEPSSCRLPDQPTVRLNSPNVCEYLKREFCTTELDAFTSYFWLLTTPSHTNISPLHHQLVKGRQIVLTEEPQLHLLWVYNSIYIKPIPRFLLSHAFWSFYLSPEYSPLSPNDRQATFGAIRGLFRSYYHLIKYKSDFDIAVECRLVPEGIEWETLSDFLSCFADLESDAVSPRYHFGEIRFTRLKFWSSILMYRLSFKIYGQYADHFSRFYAPLLFIFGVITVVLSAMQVALATDVQIWSTFTLVCRWFAVITILLVALIGGGLLLKLLKMVGDEVLFMLSKVRFNRRKRRTLDTAKSDSNECI